jgi:hypothetical protein
MSGDYYLKPLLKEYRFEPPQMTLHIAQGQKVAATFIAHRVAYSVYGKGRDKSPHLDSATAQPPAGRRRRR